MNKHLRTLAGVLVLGLALGGCAKNESPNEMANQAVNAQQNEQQKDQQAQVPAEEQELLVYAGAGLKKSMEEIKVAFEKDHPNVSLQLIYAGSGQLLAQLEQSGKGDLFIVGSKPTFEDAQKKGLTGEGVGVAHHTPCIVVAKSNPLGITSLEDLTRDGVKVALGDPEANAIGKTAVKIFEKNHIEGVEKNVVVKTGTVNELYMAITSGNADVAVVTKDGAFNNQDKVDIIEIPAEKNVDQIITAATLNSTNHADTAQAFLDFLHSDEAKIYWENHGFTPVK